jgi:hypothetical protein
MRSARHVCPPCFEVVLGDDDEDFPRKIYADTAQDAAEKAVDQSDYGERALNGGEVDAKVTSFDGETEIYVVTGEVVSYYHAIKK